ncbi:MAG: DUF159 family protein [Pelagibacteraceae bacterium]|nr:DUF159 family protein [Pelagibacteraceae bacterium]PPR51320.1 MAG: putative SOS response-associated peptidase YedK [Alphaproteobacteria bacterium MarineAlpha5_Bin10]|tara:strand:+ start:121 stop:723 length:603 start_codon:yes stop_codon:yes gene_type:complete
MIMCGRYTLSNKGKVKEKFNKEIIPNFNIAPRNDVLLINKEEKVCVMNWNYNPSWAKKPMNLINARSETLIEKPSFKESSRCILIADGWYEWQRERNIKKPYYHFRKNELVYFAGIYNKSSGCAIVTKESHKKFSFIHNRQPVLLEEKDFSKWLNGQDIFESTISEEIDFYQVNNKINNPKNNNPDNLLKFNKNDIINYA